MNYYISRGGQQYGPYSLAQLQSMKSQGQVADTDLAWGEGMASWTPLSQVMAASGAAAAPQPAPQQPVQPQYTPQAQAQPYTPQQQYSPQPQAQYSPQPSYSPQPQQQYSPQGAAYGAAPAVAPYTPQAYTPGGFAPQPSAAGPMPPSLHWALVLLLGLVVPFFAIIWFFMELGFVKKIDAASQATKQLVIAIVSAIGGVIIAFGFAAAGASANSQSIALMGGVLAFAGYIVCIVFSIKCVFSMRRSIENYYNTVEPIGLRLSGVMTFFFNIYYFQYHFTRIANWKTTGQLV